MQFCFRMAFFSASVTSDKEVLTLCTVFCVWKGCNSACACTVPVGVASIHYLFTILNTVIVTVVLSRVGSQMLLITIGQTVDISVDIRLLRKARAWFIRIGEF